MNPSDYLLDQDGKDWPTLLAEWRSELPAEFTLWLVNRFGDLFIVLDEGDNLEPTDLAVHCSVLAQIHAKTKDMPPGTAIGKVGIE